MVPGALIIATSGIIRELLPTETVGNSCPVCSVQKLVVSNAGTRMRLIFSTLPFFLQFLCFTVSLYIERPVHSGLHNSKEIEKSEWNWRQKRQSISQCPASGWTQNGTNCYLSVKSQIDQPTAEVNCRRSGGHLVSVGSSIENDFLTAQASSIGAQSIWIGLRFQDNTTGWKWLTQLPFNYSNWADSQPTDPNNQRCVILNSQSNGKWETRQCFPATADGYVCVATPTTVVSDPCQPNPCQNGGACTSNNSSTRSTCTCRTGFTGETCGTPSSVCASNPCLNDGTCLDGGSNFQCTCPRGFTGTRCEISPPVTIQSGTANSTCSVGTCLNGGTCIPANSRFTCNCPSGFTGTRCEISVSVTSPNVPSCSAGSCLNGGTCLSNPNGVTCNCPSGFTGSQCQTNNNECASNPCLNGGTCVDGLNEFTCKCTTGWSGPTCSQQLANCNPNPCKHNGTCYTLSTTEYICKCTSGYVGTQCEEDVDECDYGVCQNGATCRNTPGSYTCLCLSGTCSGSISASPISNSNNCANGQCRNGGTCISQIGTSYSCTCPTSYTGTNCEIVISGQSICSSSPCLNGGICNANGGQYTCTCPSGYTGQICQNGAIVVYTPSVGIIPIQYQSGGSCPKGFTGSTCTVSCPSGWTWSSNACYIGVGVAGTYDQAVSTCPQQQTGSYLLTVQSQSEFDNAAIIMNQIQSNIWMGLKYDVSSGQFIWITGSVLGPNDFKAWGPGQPKNQSTKNCGRITANAGFIWEMEDCNHSLKLICKYKG